MEKKHIIRFGYQSYAVDSISAATQAVALLSKLQPVEHMLEGRSSDEWYWTPESREDRKTVSLELNQNYRGPKTKKAQEEPLGLPKPKRGTILCICEKSCVAPGETCTHCGRPFSESHNRTHGSDHAKGPTLRLL